MDSDVNAQFLSASKIFSSFSLPQRSRTVVWDEGGNSLTSLDRQRADEHDADGVGVGVGGGAGSAQEGESFGLWFGEG